MEEGFDIHIKDNFLDKEIYKLIYDKIPFYIYDKVGTLEPKDNKVVKGIKYE